MAGYVNPWWQATLLPDKWSVGGVVVNSLSLWHVFALDNIGNKYATGGACDRNDAAGLLLFAQTDMAGGRRLMLSPFHRARQMRRMHRKLKRLDWVDLHTACIDYTESCLRRPDHFSEGGGKPVAAPYCWHLVLTLTDHCGATLDRAWNTPYAAARCYRDVWAESQGDTTLASEAAQEAMDRNMQQVKA